MSIWKHEFTLQGLNDMSANTIVTHLGIQFSEFGDDYLAATMSVNANTVQPFRILHGGASVVLAETVGSVASTLCVEEKGKRCVGVSINASHLRPAHEGTMVKAICTPIRLGRTSHVWDIKIQNEEGKLTCVCRLTMAVV